MQDKPDLAALIGSRICHDLISPIGAIGNGLELMLMEADEPGPELALIAESVAQANARIRHFRLIYGATGGDLRIARSEVEAILADVSRSGRLRIAWTSPRELSRPEVKLALLLVQCLESALAWGGDVTVEAAADGRWHLQGRAPRLKLEAGLWQMLSPPHSAGAAPVTAAELQFALAPALADQLGRRLQVELGEGRIRLDF